ncbi:hypothetical protein YASMINEVIRUS_14 [Yasminevirus sp. GU-2018]|uniref:Uncharacterized protein n=1 Tax=Yasminevirus sp. GU-2018 TaxID=2420051 RepID=A0A5K0U851_9VIRU|nr:hypothetical protein YASMINEVIRUS_14 [Yasminevirus sp. GU-2018]
MDQSTFDHKHNSLIFDKNSFLRQIATNDYTFTHELSGIKDERTKFVSDHVRFFRDMTTESFVKCFMSDAKTRFGFINYTYHAINTALQTKINQYLIENKQKPLYGKEEVVFVFKGGNIMNFFVEAIVNDDANAIMTGSKIAEVDWDKYGVKNVVLDQNDDSGKPIVNCKDLIDFIKTKFRISDIDYSIVINADNYARYTLIYGGVVKILADTLTSIGAFFDSYFNNCEHHKAEVTKMGPIIAVKGDTTVPNVILDSVGNELTNMKNLVSHPYLDEIISAVIAENDAKIQELKTTSSSLAEEIIEYIDELLIKDPLELIENFVNSVTTQTLFSLLIVHEYLQVVDYLHAKRLFGTMENSKYSMYVDKILTAVETSLKNKRSNVILSDFYTKEKIDVFQQDVVKRLNDAYDKTNAPIKKYELNFTGLVIKEDEVTMKNKTSIENVKIMPRNGMIMSSINDSVQQLKNKQANDRGYHYITFNNVIHTRQPSSICFDLMRIKFNVVCDKTFSKNGTDQQLSIPSEFIDVSLPKWPDHSLRMFLKHNSVYELGYSDDTIDVSVLSYDLEEICLDLQYVLFEQNYYCPWLDRKYEKRLFRLVFMLCCFAHETYMTTNPKNNKEIEKFLNVVRLADTMVTFMSSDDVTVDQYPYDALKEFLVLDNMSVISQEIKNVEYKYKYQFIYDLVCVNHDYHMYSNLIKSIIIFSFMYKLPRGVSFDFINTNRVKYGYIPYENASMDAVFTDYKKMFIAMLKIVADIGAKSYHLLQLIRDNLPEDQAVAHGGGSRRNKYEDLYNQHKFNYQRLLEMK